jgi:hypothetical protein
MERPRLNLADVRAAANAALPPDRPEFADAHEAILRARHLVAQLPNRRDRRALEKRARRAAPPPASSPRERDVGADHERHDEPEPG